MVEQLSFESATGFLLARLGSMAGRSWQGMLREHGLSPHEHAVLLTLRERQELGQRALSRVIAVDPRNLVPIIEGLVARGLLHRAVDPTDRRRRLLTLTRIGGEAADRLARAAIAIERQFLSPLTPEQQRQLNQLLRTLRAAHDPGN